MDPGNPSELTIITGYQEETGYQKERLECSARGSGVSVYVRNSIRFNQRTDVPIEDIELISIEILPHKYNSFLVPAWYRSPKDPIRVFENLEPVLSFLDNESKEVTLLGDTNCGLTKRIANQPIENHARQLSQVYDLFRFKQLIQEPTRISLTTSSLIDHIATTCTDNFVDSGVLQVSMSDPYLVYCLKFYGAQRKDHKVIKTRSMKILMKLLVSDNLG